MSARVATCRRCRREKPLRNRKRGLCAACTNWCRIYQAYAEYPPLLPPLAFYPTASAAERRAKAREWHAAGYSNSAIAAALGVTKTAVWQYINHEPPPPPIKLAARPLLPALPVRLRRANKCTRIPTGVRREMAQLWDAGYTQSAIAEAYDVSPGAVCKAVQFVRDEAAVAQLRGAS